MVKQSSTQDEPAFRRRAFLAFAASASGAMAAIGAASATVFSRGIEDPRVVLDGPRTNARYFDGIYAARESGLYLDGVNDDLARLNQLIVSVHQSGGGSIVFPSAKVRLSGRVEMLSNVSLVGAGSEFTKFMYDDGGSFQLLYAPLCSQIKIRGIQFDGGKNNSLPTVSIALDGCRDVVIEGCRFVNTKQSIFFVDSTQGSNHILIKDNVWEDVVDQAVRLDARGDADSVTVSGNLVKSVSPGVGGTAIAAFRLRGTNHSVIRNTVLGSFDTGVMVAGSGTSSVLIAENNLHTTKVGIFVGSSVRNVRIVGNDVASDEDFGIHLFDGQGQPEAAHSVYGNVIHDCGKSGISVEGIRGFSITGNTVTNCASTAQPSSTFDNWRAGLAVVSTSNGPCENYAITGNVIRDNRAVPLMLDAIRIQSAGKGATVVGNSVSGAIANSYNVSTGLSAPYYIQTDKGILSSN
ncbi:right-handed parallel beta-helix repeat-containing protein [Subtercola sp. RTI3]|uniref:right-handed parallel beta-helix repeat-containing protein n=1 Tax=Subtercola sp. RTI3 TaxID=3048639 RepID=UPI002B232470|nr:right-handed parallel beta-helix repeat-containing protein [Subtercola sp. RTI3]MEA9985954.1 right-handed parallel beta-helix repeat-containing protein [Subtercola sp. RTI3]